jgi:predicted transposase YbfD/YdcC
VSLSCQHRTCCESKSKLIITSVLNSESEYSENQIAMATYLVTLQHFINMQGKKFTKFKTEALKHIVQDMKLFHCDSKNMRIHRVVNKEENQTEIIQHLHDHSEHKSVKFTYWWVSLLYWWTRLYSMIKKHCQSCEKCQWCAKALHNDTIFWHLLVPYLRRLLWMWSRCRCLRTNTILL